MSVQLSSLPCFKNIVRIDRMSSGLSSQCFQVCADGEKYFAKKARADESQLHLLAARHGVSPEVIYHDQQWLVCKFIYGINLAQGAQQLDNKIAISLNLMSQCHQLSAISNPLEPDKIILPLIKQANFSTQQQTKLLAFAKPLIDDLALLVSASKNTKLVCCHGDINFSNIIITKQQEAFLVDYECACTALAEYDLAMLIAVNQLPKNKLATIATLYQQSFDYTIDQTLIAHYLAICYLINGLWYYNQHKSHQVSSDKFLHLAQQQWQHLDKDIAQLLSP